MTDPARVHFTLVVDRSGSVHRFREDFEGGINLAIKDQAAGPVPTTITIVQFDDKIETVTRMTPAGEVPEYQLRPRGSTALLDAVGFAVTQTGEDLAALPEDRRPGRVMVIIFTDGLENSSREWTTDRVRETIAHQRKTYDWEFAFNGADETAWAGRELGIQHVHTYAGTAQGAAHMTHTTSRMMSGYSGLGVVNYADQDDDE